MPFYIQLITSINQHRFKYMNLDTRTIFFPLVVTSGTNKQKIQRNHRKIPYTSQNEKKNLASFLFCKK